MTQSRPSPIPLSALPGPRGLPFVGNLHQFRLDRLHLKLEEWSERYGPLYRIRMGRAQVAVLSDRSTIRRIYVQRPDGFRRTRRLESVAQEMGLRGVFAAEGEDWRRQRRIVAAALNRTQLDNFFPQLAVTVERLQRRWQRAADAGEPVDLCRDLMRFTVDVTMQLAFGVDANTLETPGPVIQRHLDKIFPVLHRRVNAPVTWWRHIRLPSDRVLERALAELRGEVGAMVRDTRARMDAEPERRNAPKDFLEAILAARETEGSGFTDDEIYANAGTLLLAGEDTTANSMAWSIHYFTKFPEHFACIRREVDDLIAPATAIGSSDQANKLPFLDAFTNEVMRLKPVAPLHILEPVKDVEILGCLIPKGTTIMLPVRRMATREESFVNAQSFSPERWLNPREEKDYVHDPGASIPFGAGPRMCPGRALALLQIRAVLAMLTRNFDVEPVHSGREVEEHLAFTMLPAHLLVTLKRRPLT